MVKFVVGDNNDKLFFHIIFWVGSGFQLLCGLILFFFTEDKYDYGIIKNIEHDITNDASINISDSMTAAVTPDDNFE